MEGRRTRFDRLWQEHAPAVAAYVRRRAPADVAEDVVAETFLVAWRRLDRIPDHPLLWLYGVARKTLANQRRSEARRGALAERLELELPAATAERPDPGVIEALAALRERDRELLMLVAWEGLTPSEAAVVLGISAAASRVRLHRARGRLAAALAARGSTLSLPEPHPKEAR